MSENNYRITIVHVDYPEAPYNESGYPVLEIDHDRPGYCVNFTGYGDDVLNATDALAYFLRTTGNGSDGTALFARWLRAFHGGSIIENGHLDRYSTYIAYTCRELEDKHGIPMGTRPEMTEWEAYVTGDVWGYVLERREDISGSDYDTIEQWVELESVYGYYGKKWAEQEAQYALDFYTRQEAGK